MSNLSNLYISQSYYGVVNLVDSTQPFTSQSQTVIQFQDGVGESLGMSVTDVKDFIFDNNVVVSQSLEVLGVISGSEARLSGDLFVSGTVHASKVITTIESSSVIYSSGSNVIGDEITDVQTIVGQTSISGSLTVIGPHSHTGDVSITGSLFVSNEISSSTISGLGNAQIYSQSVDNSLNTLSQSIDTTIVNLSSSIDTTIVNLSSSLDSRLDFLEGPFSTSVDDRLDQLEADSGSQDSRLDNLELFTASQETINSGYNSFTQSYFVDSASVDLRLDNLESFSSSLDTNFVSEVEFASYSSSVSGAQYVQDQRLDSIEAFTQSLVADFVTEVEYSASIAGVTGSLITQINTKLDTGSYLVDSASFDSRINTKLASSWTGSVFIPFSSSVDSRININASNLTSVSASFVTTITNLSSSIATTDLNQQNQINSLISATGSYATTGSNTFVGNQVFSGSVQGDVHEVSLSSLTASIDCSLGNFFTFNPGSADTFRLEATNITGGRTITLRVIKTNSSALINVDSGSIKMPLGFGYTISGGTNVTDILTFVTFDTGSLYGVSSYNFV
jgi:hypothetical protein